MVRNIRKCKCTHVRISTRVAPPLHDNHWWDTSLSDLDIRATHWIKLAIFFTGTRSGVFAKKLV